jgi:hypothetical protein
MIIDQGAEKGFESAKQELGLAYKFLTDTPPAELLRDLQQAMAQAVKASLLDKTESGVIPPLSLT